MQLSTILVTLVAFATSALAAPTDMTMSGEKRFVGGWCGLHVKVSSEDSMKGTVKVYDSKQFLLAQQDFSGSGTITGVITAQNGMGKDLSFNVQTSGDNIVSQIS